MPNRTRRLHAGACLAAALVLLGLVTGCGSSGSTEKGATTLSIGTEPWIGYGPWWIVKEKGFDKANGFELKLTNFDEDAPLASAFAAGQIDGENLSLNGGLTHLAAGQPVSFVLFEDISRTADAILAGPGINSVADLRGKTVAFEEGSTSDVLLRYALEQNGMSIDDVKVVHLPAAEAGSAVIAGKVDAAVTYEPYLTAAVNKSPNFHLIYTADERPGLISDLLAVNSEFAKNNPTLIAEGLAAWNEAIDFYNEHKKEAEAIIAKKVGAPVSELETSFNGVELFGLPQSQKFLRTEFKTLGPTVEKILKQQGVLEGSPNIEAAVMPSYGEEAEKMR